MALASDLSASPQSDPISIISMSEIYRTDGISLSQGKIGFSNFLSNGADGGRPSPRQKVTASSLTGLWLAERSGRAR
jgi:hypothetical protein